MSDTTPVTDDDRLAHKWAHANKGGSHDSVARAIFRHVPAPTATLAEELRKVAADYDRDGYPEPIETYRHLADRADELEERTRQAESYAGKYHEAIQQRDEARAERDEFMNDMISSERKQAKLEAEVERLTATFKETLKEPGQLPDPADVPSEEMWLT